MIDWPGVADWLRQHDAIVWISVVWIMMIWAIGSSRKV